MIELLADEAVIQIAADGKHKDLAFGPYRDGAAQGVAGSGASDGVHDSQTKVREAMAPAPATGPHRKGERS